MLEESNEGALNNTASSSDVLEREAGTAKQNKRYLIFCELLDTEQNYVDVLRCILKVSSVILTLTSFFRTTNTNLTNLRKRSVIRL